MDDPFNRIAAIALRIRSLQWGADHLTQKTLAAALDIDPRALRMKLEAKRGVTDSDLTRTADALDAHAATLRSRAEAIRQLLA